MKRQRDIGAEIAAAKRRRYADSRVQIYRNLPRRGMTPGRLYVPRSVGNPQAVTERKYFDSEVNALTIPTTAQYFTNCEADPATLNCLFAPVTGDDYFNRTGRKVQVIGIKIRGEIQIGAQSNQTVEDQCPIVRLALVMDKQTNGVQLSSEDVFQGQSNIGAGYLSFQNGGYFGRFKVLKDKLMGIRNPVAVYDGTNIEQAGYSIPFKWSVKFRKPILVHFNATNGGTIADIVDNSFHVLAGQSVAGFCTLSYKARTTFLDQ